MFTSVWTKQIRVETPCPVSLSFCMPTSQLHENWYAVWRCLFSFRQRCYRISHWIGLWLGCYCCCCCYCCWCFCGSCRCFCWISLLLGKQHVANAVFRSCIVSLHGHIAMARKRTCSGSKFRFYHACGCDLSMAGCQSLPHGEESSELGRWQLSNGDKDLQGSGHDLRAPSESRVLAKSPQKRFWKPGWQAIIDLAKVKLAQPLSFAKWRSWVQVSQTLY